MLVTHAAGWALSGLIIAGLVELCGLSWWETANVVAGHAVALMLIEGT